MRSSRSRGLVFPGILLSCAVGVIALGARSSSASAMIRHILMTVSQITSNGQSMQQGEIAYDPANAGIVAHLGSSQVAFSTRKTGNPAIGVSSFVTGFGGLQMSAGSKIRMTDGTFYTVTAADAATYFDISVTHAATPMIVGWNYLFLAQTSSGLKIYSSPNDYSPVLPSGVTYQHIGYLGAVEVSRINNGSPFLYRAQKLGNSYYFLDPIEFTGSVPANVPLDVPGSASRVRFSFSEQYPTLAGRQQACFQIGATANADCLRGFGELYGNPVLHITHTTSTPETYSFEVLGFEEFIDFYRGGY